MKQVKKGDRVTYRNQTGIVSSVCIEDSTAIVSFESKEPGWPSEADSIALEALKVYPSGNHRNL